MNKSTTGADVATDERAAFEAWAVGDDGGWMPHALARNPEGHEFDYRDNDVQAEWRAWSARAKLAGAPAEPPKPVGAAGLDKQFMEFWRADHSPFIQNIGSISHVATHYIFNAGRAAAAGAGDTEQNASRYQFVRTLSPRAFTEMFMANISGLGAFDDLVDAAMQALAPTQPTGG